MRDLYVPVIFLCLNIFYNISSDIHTILVSYIDSWNLCTTKVDIRLAVIHGLSLIKCRFSKLICRKCDWTWTAFSDFLSRWKAIQVYLGRLHLEVCPLWWADEALQETHRGEALQVCRLWPQLLQIWPLGPAPTETHAGVNQTERDKERDGEVNEKTHTHMHTQAAGGAGSPCECFQPAWTRTHTHTLSHSHPRTDTDAHMRSSFIRREDGDRENWWTKVHRAWGAQNRVTSGSSLVWNEETAGSFFVFAWSIIGNCLFQHCS